MPDSSIAAFVLIGVAGSGKTTVGRALASALGWTFRDADEFHPPANIAKMAAGIPLDDADREPWLAAIRAHIERALRENIPTVVTCSALKEIYRQKITVDPAREKLIYLKGSPELLAQRIGGRTGHFMKADMLASQLATWEEPRDAFVQDISATPDVIVKNIRAHFGV